MTEINQPNPSEVEAEARRIFREFGGNALIDAFDRPPPTNLTKLAFEAAVQAKIAELIRDGYEPPPLPEAGLNERLPNGSVRLMARTAACRKGAEDAFSSQVIEDWVFWADGEDEKITGVVTAITPVHAMLIFTVCAKD